MMHRRAWPRRGFCAALGFAASAQPAGDFTARYRGFLDHWEAGLRRCHIVGSSFLLVRNGRVGAVERRGLMDQAASRPVEPGAIYHWASITKTFNGIAIMQLRDRKLLRLEDPAVAYLPELKQVHNPFGSMERITVAHLLSHSAGFRMATWPWGGEKWHPFEPERWEQVAAMLPYTRILFEPGSRYGYSNPGYVFLGRIIELLAREPFETYIDKNILRPLEMHRSFFDAAPRFLLKLRSHSYRFRGGKIEDAPFDFDTGVTVSNGGLNAPVEDMERYLRFLLGDPAHASRYEEVLARASLEEMWRPRIPVGPGVQMGLSFFVEDEGGRRFIGHSGGQNGFITRIYARPESRSGYLLAFNTEASPGEGEGDAAPSTRRLERELRDYLFRQVFPLLESGR
jgi:CubicO group peptidase (beta-lactamase class C family)